MSNQVYRVDADAATIIDTLGRVGPNKANCPVCGGKSLSVNEKNGKIVVHCFKGCDQHQVIEALHQRGLSLQGTVASSTAKADDIEDRIKVAKAIWRAAKGGDTSTVPYLRKRGIKRMPKCARLLTASEARKLNIGLPGFPALVFPIYRRGELTGCHVIKLTKDMSAKLEAKKPKQSWGSLKGGYIPLGDADPAKPLVIGEGVETVLSAMQMSGLPAGIATTGADFLRAVEPPKAAEYIVAGDNDAPDKQTGKQPGQEAAKALADRLVGQGHKVRVAIAPNEDSDWNDVLQEAKGDTAELRQSLTEGTLHQVEQTALTKTEDVDNNGSSAIGPLVLPQSAPMVWADKFVKARYVRDGVYTLVYYRGNWYVFNGSYYAAVEQITLERELLAFFEKALVTTEKGPKPFNPTHAKASQIVEIMKRVLLEPSNLNPPFMRMADGTRQELSGLIMLRNGALDAATRRLTPPDPRLFAVNCLPFDYDPNAPQPERWRQFINELWPGDEYKQERINLQKLFGLLLTTETRYQKAFMMIGPRRSGKSTIGKVLTGLLGRDNVVFPKMNSLTGEFGLQPLIDKQVAILTDARISTSSGASRVAECLLSISGEDAQSINRKYLAPWSGKLGVRFLILTNELPRIIDVSGALPSRFIIWQLYECFEGREDLTLEDKLMKELPGILNWALRGVDRLAAKPRFIMPRASRRALRTLQELSSPVSLFLRECCVVGVNDGIRTTTLYKAWCAWCEQNGQRATSDIVFGRDLSAQMPHIVKTGKPKRYRGIDLNDDGRELLKTWLRASER